MLKVWRSGQKVALRGIVNKRVWYAMSTIVVKDSLTETVLLLTPGSQCVYPEGYFKWKHGDFSQGTRWQEAKDNEWKFRKFKWIDNRILILLEPQKYYSIYYMWSEKMDQFIGYYINFQLPYSRSHCGFDSLDLDLDIIVDPDYNWSWKDKKDYEAGVKEGGIKSQWDLRIKESYSEIFNKINNKRYPINGAWLTWRPNPLWSPPQLPKKWAVM